jgi:soluble lytic murein transglycosylase-like protein
MNEAEGMEKYHKKALAHALNWGSACAKIGLTSVLFVPPLLGFKYAVPAAPKPGPVQLAAKIVQEPQPEELVKIYSIVKANRPTIAEREAWKLSTLILDESATRDVDPMLVLAVINVESGFSNHALSPMGARGIMQIMPETGRYLAEELFRVDGFKAREFRPDHLHDPALNIKLGVFYLDGLKKQFRNLSLALLAYNFGPGEIRNRLDNNVELSDAYAAMVLAAYREYRKIDAPVF